MESPKTTKEEINAVLAKHHLADRPPFFGPPLTVKTLPAYLAVIDTALKKGELGHLDFHGVGGDWHVTPMDWYLICGASLAALKSVCARSQARVANSPVA